MTLLYGNWCLVLWHYYIAIGVLYRIRMYHIQYCLLLCYKLLITHHVAHY